jgi:hypothetical protein
MKAQKRISFEHSTGEVGLNDENLPKGSRAVEARLRDATVAARPVRTMLDALDVPTTRSVRGAAPNANALQVGYRPGAEIAARGTNFASIADATGADIVVAPAERGFIVVRPRPAPPSTVSAPNPTSMHEAVNLAVRQVSLGPPTVSSPKVVFQNVGRSDAVRHVESLIQRGEAVAGAGGKPPFGGNRQPFALADAPEPNRRFDYSLMGRDRAPSKGEAVDSRGLVDRALGLVRKGRERIFSESANAKAVVAVKPEWSSATIRFPAVRKCSLSEFRGIKAACT